MSLKHLAPLLLAGSLVLPFSTPGLAGPVSQGLTGPNGQLQQGSMNHLAMARGGRYVVIPDVLNAFGNDMPGLYVRDMQLQQTAIIAGDGGASRFYAISPNGRYLSWWSSTSSSMILHDRVYGIRIQLPATANDNIGLSDNGYALFNKQQGSGTQLVRYRLRTGSEQVIASTRADLGDSSRRNPLSADGQVALFGLNGTLQVYRAASGQSSTFQPQWNGTALAAGSVDLASSGQYIGFASPSAGGHYLYRAAVLSSGFGLERFDLTSKKVTVTTDSGLSISADGRHISFYGTLLPGHPEYAAAQAVGSPAYGRIFRYDTRLNQLATVSIANNGAQIRGPSGGTPLVNSVSMISDDGSVVMSATNAQNILSTPVTNGGEQNYYTYMGSPFASNFQFVNLPHSESGFRPYAPMKLVGHHLWEGTISFDEEWQASFRIEAGGRRVNGAFDSSNSFFGADSTPGSTLRNAGAAVANGQHFILGAGFSTYRITFNDQTLKYTFSKPDWKRTVVFIQGQTVPGQDMFVRGGIDHGYALNTLGRSCQVTDFLCAVPIRYRNTLNSYSANWKVGDTHLDWYGAEAAQMLGNANGLAQGTVLDWTTNNPGNINSVAQKGVGYTPLNTWGDHYWMLDVDMDCSQTVNGWFELKSFISNGPGWEANVSQVGAPYASGNHFARCGQLNRFQRGNNSALILPLAQ